MQCISEQRVLSMSLLLMEFIHVASAIFVLLYFELALRARVYGLCKCIRMYKCHNLLGKYRYVWVQVGKSSL